MAVLPAAMAVTRPLVETIATPALELDHVTSEVTSAIVPSEYVPVALNCRVSPTVKADGDDGEIATEERVLLLDVTVKVITSLVTPERDAVIDVMPSATPVASPAEEMMAV
jgi:hypothetical protein